MEYVESFFWHFFCDNYLEIIKTRAYGDINNLRNFNQNITENEVQKGKISSTHTIFHALETILKLLAPFIPHITEELYSVIFPEKHKKIQSIHARNTWPDIKLYPCHENTIPQGKFIVDVMDLVRKEKSSNNLSVKSEIRLLEIFKNNKLGTINDDVIFDLASVCNAKEIKISNQDTEDITISLDFAA